MPCVYTTEYYGPRERMHSSRPRSARQASKTLRGGGPGLGSRLVNQPSTSRRRPCAARRHARGLLVGRPLFRCYRGHRWN